MRTVTAIAAVALNGVIGNNGKLPWHQRADMERFRRLTEGHTVIMGRRTYQSLGCALTNRRNFVVTSQPEKLQNESGIVVYKDFVKALSSAFYENTDIFIIGGKSIYRQAFELDAVDKVEITRIMAEPEGDTLFPFILDTGWKKRSTMIFFEDSQNDYPYAYETYEKTK